MKLYYAPGTCSLSPHIVAREAGIPLVLERVDIGRLPHSTANSPDFGTINPNGYVPVLELDVGWDLVEIGGDTPPDLARRIDDPDSFVEAPPAP